MQPLEDQQPDPVQDVEAGGGADGEGDDAAGEDLHKNAIPRC